MVLPASLAQENLRGQPKTWGMDQHEPRSVFGLVDVREMLAPSYYTNVSLKEVVMLPIEEEHHLP